ncbi:membrane protein of ER body-like protein isoform X3 [Cicer arietinum]|uniref:Membrane protein of ER body-like protein isoform X3 n=1 Tax=Cicer arietinum TaxID=3827 RepID=A0A1S3DZ41_CICAR|nr:membrane protein of ER body-like protein isoform X3 [Cicer arietinum]
MDQQDQLLIVHDNNSEDEEVEDFALKRTLPHVNNNNLVADVVGNGFNGHSNGDSTIVDTNPDGFSLHKEDEVEENGIVGEYNSDDGKEDFEVAEFVEEPTNGEAITSATVDADIFHNNNNKSVHFDNQQGNEVNGLNEVQNGDVTMSKESKFDEQVEKSSTLNSVSGEVGNRCMTTEDDKVPSDSELSALHNSPEIQAATPAVNFHEETKNESNNLIKEIEQQEEKEFDVELILSKQDTHDLFCPNCKSCITKRVILKKRKRNVHVLDNKAKRDKFDNVINSTITNEVNQSDYENVTSEIITLDPSPPLAADDVDVYDHPEKEVEVFRCLSCLSIFIPSGKGFNLFRNFGGGSKHETSQNSSSITASSMQNPSNTQGSNANWFISLFTSNKRKTATEQAGDPSEQHQSTITSTVLSTPDIHEPQGPLANAAQTENAKPLPDINHGHERMNSPISSNGGQNVEHDFIEFLAKEQSLTEKPRTDDGEKNKTSVHTVKTNNVEVTSSMNFSNGTVSEYKSVKSVTTSSSETHVNSTETTKGTVPNHYGKKPEFLVPTSTTVGSLIIVNSSKDANKTPKTVKNNDSSLMQGGAQSPVQSFDSTVLANNVTNINQSSVIDATFPSKTDITLIEKVRQDIDEEINRFVTKENKGDVIVVVDGEEIESTRLQREDNVPVDVDIVTESQTLVVIDEEPQKREIIKSIVYGGLVESITSLGIVSSAASSGATPLNIIVLGFANLIGGLFILGHNLKDLKNDHTGEQQLQTNVQDRYQELLGRRSNFVFHAVIALFSFLIFGSVPLVIYGVLINKNYYDEVKLAIVAATSVVCIILLAIGKVYTRRPPKSYIKTVLYYVAIALVASGISYIAGKLIEDLIAKLGRSESGFSTTMPISDTSMEKTWMSY